METNQTEEGNRIIALFMGLRYDEHDEAWTDGKYAKHDILKYHSSWDWLMPVYNKCNQVLKELLNSDKQPELIHNKEFVEMRRKFYRGFTVGEITFEKAYPAVVQFIQWYNTQTSQTK